MLRAPGTEVPGARSTVWTGWTEDLCQAAVPSAAQANWLW